MERLTRGRREDTVGPVGDAIVAARELLELEIVCVSRILHADERRRIPGDGAELTTLSDDAVTIPLESADGRLYGSLVCSTNGSRRQLDERGLRFLRALGRLIGGQIERDESDLSDRRAPAESEEEDEAEQHERRAAKASYLREKLEQRAEAERRAARRDEGG